MILALTTITPVYALDSDVNETFRKEETGSWGKPTSIEPVEVITAANTYNINISKDSAFIPPAFGSYSADTKGTGELLTPNLSGVAEMNIGSGKINAAVQETVSGGAGINASGGGTILMPPNNDVSSGSTENRFTLPDALYAADGSIGKLKIPVLNFSVKVYETESLESLAKGAGHFKSTSCWEGNVGICGHNRGVTNHFGKLHTLEKGDQIEYTTKLGTKTYQVVSVVKIDETDFSYLQRTSDNRITLITCVNNQSQKRWCVQAVEM